MTSVLIGVLWCVKKLKVPGRRAIGVCYFRLLRKLLRVRVRVVGTPMTDKPVLILSNHVSRLDIPTIGSIMPLVFISKSEVRDRPLIGPAAELLHTILSTVRGDRKPRRSTPRSRAR